MKKRIYAVFAFTLALLVCLCACSSTTNPGSSSGSPSSDPSGNSSQAEEPSWEPTGTITLICPFNAGSVGDTFSRPFAEIMSKYAGVTVVVENMGGGSGSIGTNYMLSQPADGYTFSYHSNTGALNVAAGTAPYGEDAVQPVCNIGSDYHVICVNADSPFQTFQDLVDYAHENPGQLKIAGAQVMGNNHLFTLLMMRDFDIEANYIPYDDGAASVLGLLGDNADCVMSTSSTVAPYLDSGEFRALAYTLPEPIEEMGDVPTFASLGSEGLANYISFKGMFISPDCPDEVKAWYDDICNKVCNDQEWLDFLALQGGTPTYMGMDEFTEYYHQYIEDAAAIFAEVDVSQ